MKSTLENILRRPDLKPGFYDDPDFVAIEKQNPAVLEDYARFVITRTHSPEEDVRTRRVVHVLEDAIAAESKLSDRLGDCANFSMAITRILEAQGIWCFMVKGSIRFDFAPELKLEPKHFWTRDVALDFAGGFMGHAWVVAPPFAIIDFTAGSQRMQHGENKYLPASVVLEEHEAPVTAPRTELYHADPRRQPSSFLNMPLITKLWASFPPRQVVSGKVKITYQPDGVSAPENGLDSLPRPSFRGRSPSVFTEIVSRRG